MEQLKNEIVENLVEKIGINKKVIDVDYYDDNEHFIAVTFSCLSSIDNEVHPISIAIFPDRVINICVSTLCTIKNNYQALKFVNKLNLDNLGISFSLDENFIYASIVDTRIDLSAIEILEKAIYFLEDIMHEVTMRLSS